MFFFINIVLCIAMVFFTFSMKGIQNNTTEGLWIAGIAIINVIDMIIFLFYADHKGKNGKAPGIKSYSFVFLFHMILWYAMFNIV